MTRPLKLLLWTTMTTALGCGFLHHLVPAETINFERLHIFLFNLCSGGTMLIHYTEGGKQLSTRGRLFFLLTLLYAICALLEFYLPTIFIPLLLVIITEQVRIRHFGSVLPKALFTRTETTARKFHQASLLCLSLGLIISSLAVLNSEFTHWLEIQKLTLNTFFLGFSFPLSLISMSVIFSLMRPEPKPRVKSFKEFSFWSINLGVIIFFLFILAGWFLGQVGIASILFGTVSLILFLYWQEGEQLQQKAFLTSGILFLLITSVSGIIYILLAFSPGYDPQQTLPLLRTHAFTALYGWNLSGLAVISRQGEFPIKLHSMKVIRLHWLTVLILCPLGFFYGPVAILAILAYARLLYVLLFNDGMVDQAMIDAEKKVLDGWGRSPLKSGS